MNSKQIYPLNTITACMLLIAMLMCAISGCDYVPSTSDDSLLTPDTEQATPTPPEPTPEIPSSTDTQEDTTTDTATLDNNTPAQTQGETKVFSFNAFSVEITNVSDERKESVASSDDPLMSFEYVVYECYPGAEITVKNAAMTDSSLTESGQPNPNWHIYLNSGDRIPITEDMKPLKLTEDMEGIGTEGVIVLAFEFQD